MATREEYGLSSAQSTGLGQANVLSTARGISEVVLSGLGQSIQTMNGYGLAELQSTGLGQPSIGVGVASAVALSSTKIRVTFDTQMLDDSALVDLDNYTITPTGLGVSIYKISMEAETVTYPYYVDITVSEMTNGQNYEVEVETGITGPTDRYGGHVDALKYSETFSGVGIDPEIKYIEALSSTSVKVVFTEAMEDNTQIRDVTNYSFDNGLSVLEVTSVLTDSVFLKTSEQTSGLLYTLTITS